MTESNILSLTPDTMRDVMQQAGYRVETIAGPNGGPQLRSATSGVPFLARFGNRLAGDGETYADVTLTAIVQLRAPVPADVLNQWNSGKRFGRLHQSGNLLALEMDLIVIGGVSRENLRAQIEIWDRVLQELMQFLRTLLTLSMSADVSANVNGAATAATLPQVAAPQPVV